MTSPQNPEKKEYPNTYVVQDRQNQAELERLVVQDRMATRLMGGVLPEQQDTTSLHRVLDVACGTGGWLIETAQLYPTATTLIGIDINQRMLDYARERAVDAQVSDRVEFHMMDALLILEFPNDYFDLVNLRAGISFLRTWEWPKMIAEMQRVTRPGGVIRVTEAETAQRTSSPALTQLNEMITCAFFKGGHFFTQDHGGLVDHLVNLMVQHGVQQVQTRESVMEYKPGTPQVQELYQDIQHGFRNARPFIRKWGCESAEYDKIYDQALEEIQGPDFHAEWHVLTTWGTKRKKHKTSYVLQ